MSLVAYYRVSTEGQFESGLGLEAQKAAVERYAVGNGEKVLREFCEVETGKSSTRMELAYALAYTRRTKSTLVIAKLDRLSRNVAFMSSLMESGLPFVACDIPQADRFTIHILVAVAEKEAFDVSARTKAALAARKARGLPMGSNLPGAYRFTPEQLQAGRKKAGRMRHEQAQRGYDEFKAEILQMLDLGYNVKMIVKRLNDQGYRTGLDREWKAKTVYSALRSWRVA